MRSLIIFFLFFIPFSSQAYFDMNDNMHKAYLHIIDLEFIASLTRNALPVHIAQKQVEVFVTEVKSETIKTHTIISPLSYLMIIISFIILVISATLFVTSGNWKFGS